MQNHAESLVRQNQMEIIIYHFLRPLSDHVRRNRLREAEKDQSLIDQMGAEIVKNSRARQWLFAPTLFNGRTKSIVMSFIVVDLAEQTLVTITPEREETILPTPVLKNAEKQFL